MSKEIKIIVLLVVTIGLLNLDQFTRFSPVLMNRLKCFINFIKKCNYNEQISESIEDEEKRERMARSKSCDYHLLLHFSN